MDRSTNKQIGAGINRVIRDSGPNGGDGLKALSQRFDKFRREHRMQARIPNVLRKATFAALRGGVTPAQVRRTCGVTTKQLDDWRQNFQEVSKSARVREVQPARVFSVVDGDAPTQGCDNVGPRPAQALELRLGEWEISVRQMGASSRKR